MSSLPVTFGFDFALLLIGGDRISGMLRVIDFYVRGEGNLSEVELSRNPRTARVGGNLISRMTLISKQGGKCKNSTGGARLVGFIFLHHTFLYIVISH